MLEPPPPSAPRPEPAPKAPDSGEPQLRPNLKPRDIVRIAEKPTDAQREQFPGLSDYAELHQQTTVAETAAREARKAATRSFGDAGKHAEWKTLQQQASELKERLSFATQGYHEAGLQLDPSQIPPTIGERVGAGLRGAAHGTKEAALSPFRAVGGALERAHTDVSSGLDSARSALVLSFNEKVGGARQRRDAAIEGASNLIRGWRRGVGEFVQRRVEGVTNAAGVAREIPGIVKGAASEAVSDMSADLSSLGSYLSEQADEGSRPARERMQAVFKGAREAAREKLGPLAEMVKSEKESIRANGQTAVNAFVGRLLPGYELDQQANQVLGEFYPEMASTQTVREAVLSAASHQAKEKALGALGLPGKGLGVLGRVKDRMGAAFAEHVGTPVAQRLAEEREAWGQRLDGARGRLNRMLEIYGDTAGPKLQPIVAVAREAASGAGMAAGDIGEEMSQIGSGIRGAGEAVGGRIQATSEAGKQMLSAAGEALRGGAERVGRVREALTQGITDRATEMWANMGLSNVDVGRRAALLRARFVSRVSDARELARDVASGIGAAVGDAREDAVAAGRGMRNVNVAIGVGAVQTAARGVAIGSLGVEAAGRVLPKSVKGRLALGGVVLGGVGAALAYTHPEIFAQLQQTLGHVAEGFGQPSPGDLVGQAGPLPGPDAAGHAASVAPFPSVVSSAPTSVSPIGFEGSSPLPPTSGLESTAAVPTPGPGGLDSITGVHPPTPPAPEVSGLGQAVAEGARAIPHPSSFSEFWTNLNSLVTHPGDTLSRVIEAQATNFGTNWANPENGVTKAQVIADQVAKFLQADGLNPDLIHSGNSMSQYLGRLTPDQLKTIQDIANTQSFDGYQALLQGV